MQPAKQSMPPAELLEEAASSRQIQLMNEKILASALSAEGDTARGYRIGPEDLLEVSVFEVEELNKTVRVSSQGNISLPLLGTVRSEGLTVAELEREIADLLGERYLQDPSVTVFVKEYRSHQISVIGAVAQPGRYNITGQKTVLSMLALAGGLTDKAGYLLFVIRPLSPSTTTGKTEDDPDQRGPRTLIVDLEELLVRGNMAMDLPLEDGDVINIPVSGKVFVGGEVMKPGGFILKRERMTVSQAIVMAGGLKPEADGSKTRVFRLSEKGPEKELLSVNVYAIQKGKEEDLYLKESDIVIVPRHGLKGALYEVRETLRSIVNIGYALGI
jgi:polysaccharide export outer membrane protein